MAALSLSIAIAALPTSSISITTSTASRRACLPRFGGNYEHRVRMIG